MPVYMYITFEGKRIRKPVTGVHSSEKSWDSKKQRIRRATKSNPFDEVESFNNRLDFIDSQLKLIKQSAFDKRTRLTEQFILDRLNDESLIKSDRYDFFAISDQYLEAVRSVQAPRTITGKTSVFNFLRDFQKESKSELSFEGMDLKFFESLRSYAFELRKIEDNYFAKIINVLKAFLNWAHEHEYIKDQTYKKFKATEKDTEVICLTLDEFIALYQYQFTSTRLAQVRDVFIFGCCTGLRFSDLISLRPNHIGDDFITKTIQKTKETLMIPLNDYSKAILEKYKESAQYPLPKVSAQKFNEYIKECCEKADIKTQTTIIRYSGGIRKETTMPKHQFVTSHAARKTFTTLSLLLGAPERIVKSITGHKKEESFRRYVNFTKEYEKLQIKQVWDNIK